MHALPSHPKHPLALGLLVLLMALLVMAAAAPDLGRLELSLGGAASAPAPSRRRRPPRWERRRG